jgi:hypothetical protein
MINVNLDGIMLLPFFQIGFKVSLLTMILALCMVLPLNITAPCFVVINNELEVTSNCDYKNITDYQVNTLANIPALTRGNSSVPGLQYLNDSVWCWCDCTCLPFVLGLSTTTHACS